MSEEMKLTHSGFRIKWADKEIEYYGDSVSTIFTQVFEYVKTVPTTLPPSKPSVGAETSVAKDTTKTAAPIAEGDYYERISKDSGIQKDEVIKFIEFGTVKDFQDPVPLLPQHPEIRDAVRLVSYALQVGLQTKQVDVSYLKRILKHDGYPLPGNELGQILDDFRGGDVLIASMTRRRNKPFSLSKKGIDQAKELLKQKKT